MKNLLILLFTTLVSFTTLAEVAVIVHPTNLDSIDKAMITKIFLGKSKTFPNGEQAIPINQENSSKTHEEFNRNVLNKSDSQLKAYWSKLLFTGKGQPPKEVSNDDDVLNLVANNPNLIGYIDATKVNSSVKVLGNY